MRKSILAFGLLFGFAGLVQAADPPTITKLSSDLAKNCGDLRDALLKPATPDTFNTLPKCTAANSDEATCRAELISVAQARFKSDVEAKLKAESDALTAAFPPDSGVVPRLHPVLVRRGKRINQEIDHAVETAWKNLAIPASTDTLLVRAQKAATDNVTALRAKVAEKLHEACIDNDAAIIEAAFPRTPTVGELAASSKRTAETEIADAEREAFAEFTKAEGFARSVECKWATVTEDGKPKMKIVCKPGLLVSGEQVSEIRIHDLPPGSEVTALTSEDFTENGVKDGKNLTYDNLEFPEAVPNPVVIAIHTERWVTPTWGGMWGSLGEARKVLRRDGRKKLSLVTSGTVPTINVKVKTGADQAETSIPVGYARWKIEGGGFLAVSPLVDDEVVTTPVNSTTVNVEKIRSADDFGQDSGVFVNFVPQNYQAIGISLGLATPPNRRMSVYIGPNLRVRTFGDRGLASLVAGLTMRSVLRFPDVKEGNLPADSAFLKGKEQFRVGWFIAVNLGFRIGTFGPAEEAR